MPHTVRTHTRKTSSGRTITVRSHDRKGGSAARPASPSRFRRIVGSRKFAVAVTAFAVASTVLSAVAGVTLIPGLIGIGFGLAAIATSRRAPKVKCGTPAEDWWADDEPPPRRPARARQAGSGARVMYSRPDADPGRKPDTAAELTRKAAAKVIPDEEMGPAMRQMVSDAERRTRDGIR